MKAFITMLPRLEARESLTATERAALGNNIGFPSEEHRQHALEALRRRAVGAPDPAPVKADPGDLAGMGIGLRQSGGDLPTIGALAEWLDHSEGSDG